MARDRPLLILLLFWALAMIVPDLVRIVQPLGSYGFYANSDGLIYDVAGPFVDEAASPAWKAGIREGDQIDLAQMTCCRTTPRSAQARSPCWADSNTFFRTASRSSDLAARPITKPGRSRSSRPSVQPTGPFASSCSWTASPESWWCGRRVAGLDTPRPNELGIFSLRNLVQPGQSFVFYAFLQQWPMLLIGQNVLASLAHAAGYAGLLHVCSCGCPTTGSTRRGVRSSARCRCSPSLFAAALLASYANAFGYSTETLTRAVLLAGFAVDIGALAILFLRRRNQSPEDYQRVRWVIWGCAIGLPAFIIAQLAQGTSLFDNLWGKTPPYDVLGLLFLANGVFCLFVVQALSRTRVVNVSIPLRRVTILGFTLSIPALLLHTEVEHIHDQLDLPNWAWLVIAFLALYLISRLHELAVHVADRYFNRALDRTGGRIG